MTPPPAPRCRPSRRAAPAPRGGCCPSTGTPSPPMALTVLLMCCLLVTASCSPTCQFPGAIQGVWGTQAITNTLAAPHTLRGGVTYSMVTIEHGRMSGWGECRARDKHYYVLAERSSRLSGPACHRCMHLLVVSPNVLITTTKRGGGCYPSVEAARAACPEVLNRHHHDYHYGDMGRGSGLYTIEEELQLELERTRLATEQTMLYRIKSYWGDESTAEVECPFSGVFTFTYERGETGGGFGEGRGGFRGEGRRATANDDASLCPHPTSEMSNCPYGFGLNVVYSDCLYGEPERLGLQCLGSWRGPAGRHYLAVIDTSVEGNDTRPKYRCGIYHEEVGTGRIHLAFSRDSTCDNQLNSPRDGYERYVLHSVPAPPLPKAVQTRGCRFPRSLEGHWTSVLLDHNTLVFKDNRNLKRYTAVCVEDPGDGEHFIVFTRTHCGDSSYNCLWLKRRSANILEYMLGLYPSESLNSSLCDIGKFGDQTSWNTVARSDLEGPIRCPVLGSFVGELPDAPGYCGRIQSHCDAPDTMTYTVTDCRDATSAYEQREYQCVGEWTEDDKVYSLTYRPDTDSHECFVGVTTPDGRMFVKEAGTSGGTCGRGVRPEIMGMELIRKEECDTVPAPQHRGSSTPPTRTSRRPQAPKQPPWQKEEQKDGTTRSWKPITAVPRWRSPGAAAVTPRGSIVLYIVTILLYMTSSAGFLGSIYRPATM